jgi:hypothetical protein
MPSRDISEVTLQIASYTFSVLLILIFSGGFEVLPLLLFEVLLHFAIVVIHGAIPFAAM